MLVAGPLALLLLGSYRARFSMIAAGVGAYLAVGLFVLPILGGSPSITAPFELVYDRVGSVTQLPAALTLDVDAINQIGRPYHIPVAIFKDNAAFGVGLGNYPFAWAEYTRQPVQAVSAFSLYLDLLTQFGIIGTSLYLLFVGWILWQLGRALRRYKDHPLRPMAVASLVSIVGVLVASLGLGGLTTDPHLWVMLAIGLMVPTLMRKVSSERDVVEPSELHSRGAAR